MEALDDLVRAARCVSSAQQHRGVRLARSLWISDHAGCPLRLGAECLQPPGPRAGARPSSRSAPIRAWDHGVQPLAGGWFDRKYQRPAVTRVADGPRPEPYNIWPTTRCFERSPHSRRRASRDSDDRARARLGSCNHPQIAGDVRAPSTSVHLDAAVRALAIDLSPRRWPASPRLHAPRGLIRGRLERAVASISTFARFRRSASPAPRHG